jgi:hypothetical protein
MKVANLLVFLVSFIEITKYITLCELYIVVLKPSDGNRIDYITNHLNDIQLSVTHFHVKDVFWNLLDANFISYSVEYEGDISQLADRSEVKFVESSKSMYAANKFHFSPIDSRTTDEVIVTDDRACIIDYDCYEKRRYDFRTKEERVVRTLF